MKFNELYSDVDVEFGPVVAANVVVIIAMNLHIRPKLSNLSGTTSFEARLKKKSRKLLWELDDESFDHCFRIAMAYYVYDVSRVMQGSGGCVAKTLKQILEEELK